MRLFFASDIHGSTTCFRKLVSARSFYGVDLVLMGGDVSGKELVPVVRHGNGWSATFRGATHSLATETEAAEFQRRVATVGGYTERMEGDEVQALRADSELVERTLARLIRERVSEWTSFADERLGKGEARLFMGLGNDDADELAELLNSRTVQFAGEESLDLGEIDLISLGWSNPTPWDTHREASEEELERRLNTLVENADPSRTVLNVHVPPYSSGLDLAPKLGPDLQIQLEGGEPKLVPVGSTAVDSVIRRFQPLLSLHGHIHEGRGSTTIGRTTTLNPGSEYDQATLLGVIIDARRGKKIRTQFVTG